MPEQSNWSAKPGQYKKNPKLCQNCPTGQQILASIKTKIMPELPNVNVINKKKPKFYRNGLL